MSDPYHIHTHRPEDEGDGSSRSVRRLFALVGVIAFWYWRRRSRASEGEPSYVPERELERGHVPEDSESAGSIAAFAGGLLVLLLAVLAVVALMTNRLERASPDPISAPGAPFTGFERVPTESPLQSDPAIDLLRVRRHEHELLSRYRWVDQEGGIVAIPIERAMEILTARMDTTSREDAPAEDQTIRLLTESGYVEVSLGVSEPGAPAYLGISPERYAVSPDFARELGIINVKPNERALE